MTRRRIGMGVLACVLAAVTACGSAAKPARPPATPTESAAQRCYSSLSYWASSILHASSDAGFDYQEMALSGGEYDILRTVVKDTRPLIATGGVDAAVRRADTELRQRCAAEATPTPSASKQNGWPD